MKLLLQLLALILNSLPKTDREIIHICHIYGKYGLNAPNLVGKTSAPTVSTASATSITSTSFVMNGSIDNTGGENPATRGFCYVIGSGGTPTTSNSTVNSSGSFSTGSFSLNITGLAVNTAYSVRAYAINSAGTSYGATVIVSTLNQSAPTVTLNTTDNTSFSTATPTLEFTGTDSQSDDIRYQIDIDNAIDKFLPSSYSFALAMNGTGFSKRGQSFLGNGRTIGKAAFHLRKTGSPTGSVYAMIYAHSGTYGTSSVPTGTPLATSDALDASTLSTTMTYTEFTFSGANQISLSSGTPYVLTLEFSGGDGSNTVDADGNVGALATHSGNLSSYDGTTWGASATYDHPFYIIEPLTALTVINATSGTDSGFLNTINNADTDPFTSGQKVSYTVQIGNALANGTYHWSVSGIDPSGSNVYGTWTSQRTFTVSVASSGGGSTASSSYFFQMF